MKPVIIVRPAPLISCVPVSWLLLTLPTRMGLRLSCAPNALTTSKSPRFVVGPMIQGSRVAGRRGGWVSYPPTGPGCPFACRVCRTTGPPRARAPARLRVPACVRGVVWSNTLHFPYIPRWYWPVVVIRWGISWRLSHLVTRHPNRKDAFHATHHVTISPSESRP